MKATHYSAPRGMDTLVSVGDGIDVAADLYLLHMAKATECAMQLGHYRNAWRFIYGQYRVLLQCTSSKHASAIMACDGARNTYGYRLFINLLLKQ